MFTALRVENVRADDTDIASGTWGTCPWTISSNGLLTIGEGTGEDITDNNDAPWLNYSSDIKQVVTSGKVIFPSKSQRLFIACENLTSVNLSECDTSNVTDMESMFSQCDHLTSADLSGWDTSNVTNMDQMFFCSGLHTLNVSGWNTSKVTGMSYMFYLSGLLESLDLSSWDTSSVTDMDAMFCCCGSLVTIKVSSLWNTDKVTSSESMFASDESIPGYDENSDDKAKAYAKGINGGTDYNGYLNKYGVIFDANGGSGTMKEEAYEIGQEKALTSNSFTKAGKTFSEWNTKADGTGTSYSDGAVVKDLVDRGTITLYAQWAPGYTVHYDANGGQRSMPDSKFKVGVSYHLSENLFFRSGYVITGWNTKADGSGTSYKLNESVTDLAEAGSTITLYAVWKSYDSLKADIPEGYYWLKNCADTSYYLTSPYNLKKYTESKSQIWHITKYGDGYRLINENDGKCLTAKESSSEVGGLSMQDETDSDYQKWYFMSGSDGKIIINAKNSYVLDSFNWGVSATNHPLQTYYVYDGGSDQKYVLEKATATVTCEDWFVDKDNNRKVKIASHTKTYDYGATANGSDWGASNIDSSGNNISSATQYVYKSSTSAAVTESGATVYRYYWAWTNLNLYNSNGDEDYFSSSCSFSIDGKAWVSGIHNEDDSRISTVQPYGTTYYIKDIIPPTYENFDHVSSNMVYDSTNKWYTYTPIKAGTVMGIKMKHNGKGGIFRIHANGGTENSYKEITYGESTVISPMPSRTGYTLTGLYTASSGGAKVINADGSPANDGTYSKNGKWTLSGYLSVYAQWTPNTYSISYDLDGGTASNPTSYNAEADFTALKAPKKTAYTFAGWTGSNGNKPQKEVYVPETSDSIKWKLDIYKYAKATATHVPSEDDIKGLSIYNSYDVTDETGSHTDRDDYYIGEMYTYVYSEKEQTVTDTLHTDDSGALYVNGTLIATNSSTATTSVTYTLNKGWNKIEILYEEAQGEDYACFGKKLLTDGIVTKMSAVKSAENLSYTANWIPNTYTVKFDANGGSGSMDNESMTYDTSANLTVNTFTRTGYTFSGWNTKADGTGTSYSDGASVKNLTDKADGTVTLYAHWTPNKYTVTCEDWFVDKDNNRKVKLASHTKDYDYGATANGSDFGTSSIDVNGKNIDSIMEYNSIMGYNYKGSTSANVTEKGATVYRYYWAWTDLNIYSAEGNQDGLTGTVSFSMNGTTWKTITNEENTVQPYGTTYYVKNITPLRPYEELGIVDNLTYDATNNWYTYTPTKTNTAMNIFMKYKNYTITYDLNDSNDSYKATNNPNNKTTYTYTDEVNLSEPARPGYFFRGWKDSDGNIVTSISKGSYGDKTFTAAWEKIPNLPSSGSRDGLIFTVVSVLGLAVILFRKLRYRP